MFESLRNLGQSKSSKQQEALSAYLDNELPPAERDDLEEQLALNSDLRSELAQMRAWQQQMRDLPVRSVPRNFTLDPSRYGSPRRQSMSRAYPMLRTATVFTALLLVISLAANVYLGDISTDMAQQSVASPVLDMDGESAPTGAAQIEMEMTADAPAETFMLEESVDMEADEVPVEIAEAEEVLPERVEEDELSMEMEAVGREELLTEKELPLSPALELIEGTSQPFIARDMAAAEETASEMPMADEAMQAAAEESALEPPMAGEAPPAATRPVPATSQDPVQPPADDTAPTDLSPIIGGLSLLILLLGLIFVVLVVLTLIARARR